MKYDETGHDWEKMNGVTKRDAHGMYDLWRCRNCGQEYRRRGVQWHPSVKRCPNSKR